MAKFEWEKLGLLFNPKDHDTPEWMAEFAQAPATVEFDEFLRVYFSCRPKPDSNGQYVSYSAYVDLDKDNLFNILNISKEPILELGTLGTFDEFGTYPVSVIKIEKKYFCYYAGWTRCKSVPYNVAIGIAESTNHGETFSKIGSGPILSYSPNEPFTVSGPKIRKFNDTYYLFYVAGEKWKKSGDRIENVFKIKLATSKNGLDWVKEDKNLIDWRLEEDECQASPDVFYLNNKYHMFYSYKYSTDFRDGKRGYRIGYASSTDLINWKREDSKAGIDLSEKGWDSQMLAYPHIFKLKDSIYMMYLGNEVGRDGFGLAKLM